jgi:hypothetical protein
MFPYNSISRQNYEQNLRNIIEQATGQLQQLQNTQPMQQSPITQNFQITPQNSNPSELQSAYVNNIDEVKNIFMTRNGIFVNKDLSTLWFKNTEGNIKTFSLIEIIEKDEKDKEIDSLRKQLDEMRTLLFQKNERKPEVYEVEEIKPEKKTTKKKEA